MTTSWRVALRESRQVAQREPTLVLLALGVCVVAVGLARLLPVLATPAYFIVVSLLAMCAGLLLVIWQLRRALRTRYLCGGPAPLGGVWICPLLATGRTRADEQRGPARDITVAGVAPLVIQHGPPRARPPRGPLIDHERLRILVVEDDATSRMAMTTSLRAAGYDVQGTGDGAEGLYLLGSGQPDVLVLDLGLPTVSGQEIARAVTRIRERVGPQARIVVVTADEEAGALGQELGIDAFLVKPIPPDVLRQTVAQVVPSSTGASFVQPSAEKETS